jgi:hypothetical protein
MYFMAINIVYNFNWQWIWSVKMVNKIVWRGST